MNVVTLTGRLGKDPEFQTSKNGNGFVKFSIATNDGYGDNKKVNWHNCTAFGKSAEIISKYVKKGSEICVSGSIDYNKNDDKIYTNILVNNFTFIGGKSDSVTSQEQAPQEEEEDTLPF